nr:hypothetical protein [Tanacetum cinerariifolium]
PEPCNQTMNNELPQTLPGFDPMCYSDKENSVPCVSKPNFVDESSNIFNPPPQPPIYSCEFCRSNAQYGHYCIPQAPFNNPEPGYSPHENFHCQPLNYYEHNPSYDYNYSSVDKSGDFHPQQYPCCDTCGGLHETFQCQPIKQNFYNPNSSGIDQTQPPQFLVIHPPPQETSIKILHDQENVINYVQTFLRKFNRYSFFETPKVLLLAWDRVFEIKDALGTKPYKPEDIQELFRQLLNDVQNIHEELVEYINTLGWNRPAFYDDDDDDDDVDYTIAITPVLSTEEPIDSLSMGDEHLDIIPATKSDEVIKSSVENLILIPSESEGIPDTMCDVHLVNNPTPIKAKDQFEIVMNSNDDISSNDDDSLYNENIEYVEASPHDSELVSLEAAEIIIPEVEEIENDNLHEKLLNVHLLIANIEALKDNPTQSFDLLTNSGSPTTQSDISLSEYDSFIFDLCPPSDRSDFYEFTDELSHIISPPEYDCFYFRNLPDLGELISIFNFEIRENPSATTRVNLPVEDDHSPLLAYVVWIFLTYLTYLVIPPYLHPFENEDTIFDPDITINRFYSSMPGLSHRCGAFKKFNTHRSHLNECPMITNGKSTPILDVLLFHFYPP